MRLLCSLLAAGLCAACHGTVDDGSAATAEGGAKADGAGGQASAGVGGTAGLGGSGACASAPGVAVQLAPSPNEGAVAVGATTLVWLSPGVNPILTSAGIVQRVPKCGGAIELVAKHQAFPIDVAVAGDTAYWTDQGANPSEGPTVSGGSVDGSPLGGGVGIVSAEDGCEPSGIAVDADYVYWTSQCGVKRQSTQNYWPSEMISDLAGVAIAVDDTNAYWLDANGGVRRAPKAGGTTTLVHGGSCAMNDQGSVVVDDTYVYWLDVCGALRRSAKAGGAAVLLAQQAQPQVWGIGHRLALDATRVYWLDGDAVHAVAKAGGAPISVAPLMNGYSVYLGGIDVDDMNVYWSDDWGVWRLRKP